MMGLEHPHNVLQQSRDTFIDEEPIRMLSDFSIFEDVRPSIPIPSGPLQHVTIGRVSTYIYQTEVSKTTGNMRIVFPTFASHWAVIVCEMESLQRHSHAYHLIFLELVAAQPTPLHGTSREVVFMPMFLESMPEGMKEVGTTQFSHADRMNIGMAIIDAFGSYHRVF